MNSEGLFAKSFIGGGRKKNHWLGLLSLHSPCSMAMAYIASGGKGTEGEGWRKAKKCCAVKKEDKTVVEMHFRHF